MYWKNENIFLLLTRGKVTYLVFAEHLLWEATVVVVGSEAEWSKASSFFEVLNGGEQQASKLHTGW